MSTISAAFSISTNLRHLFFRPTANINVIDGLRALSMLMILLFHSFMIYVLANPQLALLDVINQGGLVVAAIVNFDKSVDVFFVISGFLITRILLKQIRQQGHIRLGNFYQRRLLRLSPLYFFVVLLFWLAMHNQSSANTDNLWANLLYVNNFLPYEEQAMNWTWSLAVEEQFYLVFPLLLMVLVKTRRPLFWFWLLWFLAILIRFLVIISDTQISRLPQSQLAADPEFHAHHFSVLYDNFYTRYGALLSGCMAAYYYDHHPALLQRCLTGCSGWLLKTLALLIITALLMVPMPATSFDGWQGFNIAYQSLSRNLFGLGLAIMILAAFQPGRFQQVANLVLGNRLLHPVAQLSYSMYLVHVVPVAIVVELAKQAMLQGADWSHPQAVVYVFLLSTLLTLLLAFLLYMLIERPLMNLRK